MVVKKIASTGIILFALMAIVIGCGSSKKAALYFDGGTTFKDKLNITGANDLTSGILTCCRTKASIIEVVLRNQPSLRYAYDHYLMGKPDLKGKIAIKFAINALGKVTKCQIMESSIGDPELETAVVDSIKTWQFAIVDKECGITEVTYPFVFSQ